MKYSIPTISEFNRPEQPPELFSDQRSGIISERLRGFTSSLAFILGLVLSISGCAVGPNYKRPAVNVPADFRGAEGQAQRASIADLPWWEVFKDERLRALVQTALDNNYDLRVAITRVEQSRQIAAQARAQYFPFINYSVASSDGRNEFVGTVSPNGGITRGAFAGLASVA